MVSVFTSFVPTLNHQSNKVPIHPFQISFWPNFDSCFLTLVAAVHKGRTNFQQIFLTMTSQIQVVLALCSVVGVWYIMKKHWLANDLLGMAFAVNGVELLHLNNVVTGCILLGGLFFYDIFWVFGTDVMVTVAKSFEAPIKLVFPQVLHLYLHLLLHPQPHLDLHVHPHLIILGNLGT